MSRFVDRLRSSVGSKMVMAVTGILLLLFVIAHMLGNLQLFAGQERLNAYAAGIQGLGPLLWAARLGLLAIFLLHVASAVRVTRLNRAARPVPYQVFRPGTTSYAARTMVMSGMVVAAFVAYHLLHFTLGATNPGHFGLEDPKGRHDVYSMVVLGFGEAPIAIAYVAAQALLCLHIAHGGTSLLQTLGVTHPRLERLRRWLGPGIAGIIFLGNCSIPLSCLLGIVKLPPGVG